MSLPLHDPPPSSSPSKSSLRKTSGSKNPSSNSLGPTTHFASEATQHHFLPHSPPNQNLDYDEGDEEATFDEDPDASYQVPQPQRPLQPFFALIEDTTTNEHYHPTVHYIFADDEPDIVTEAACRSLEQNEESNVENIEEDDPNRQDDEVIQSRLPPPRPGIREHYLILDVHPSSVASTQQLFDHPPSPSPSSVETAQALTRNYPYTVASAQSLSSDWQIIRTNITDAPTMNGEHELDDHLMLRIEGRGNSPDKAPRKEREVLEDMIDRFQARLAEIRHLMIEIDDPQEQGGEPEDIFTQDGLVGMGFRLSGFGNAVLDEQD
ncbi:hypothetical protein H2198_007679 [Neophaeococcomyces mojaviensis]|uniref:Uncharacterized protein n=1 Tax=Neophaeococcomyces mojaviensis TaxID=3383035 RepID=A0ACC2ZZA4_9EURO|nr:hypothetical protein H2198_007679 [Knufia sp. JES_112]